MVVHCEVRVLDKYLCHEQNLRGKRRNGRWENKIAMETKEVVDREFSLLSLQGVHQVMYINPGMLILCIGH
jgi:hypothetical protein